MRKLFITTLVVCLTIGCQQKEAVQENVKINNNDAQSNNTTIEAKELKQPRACTKDAKSCPDGSTVGRDGNNNCEFFKCPSLPRNSLKGKLKGKKEIMCTTDVKECSDGSFVGRDHKNNCKFKACPN
jgi:hypothetical protein